MSYIIRIIAPKDGSYKIPLNFYVHKFDGDLHITTLKKEAKRFTVRAQALALCAEMSKYNTEILEEKNES